MIGAQFEFTPFMLQGPEYNCSEVMPPEPSWSAEYGVRQLPLDMYSIVFGVITEILYIPCIIVLYRDKHTACFKIMFWLGLLDMTAILDNSIMYGAILLRGDVYCSNPAMAIAVGMTGYGVWFTASTCCIVLGLNRLFIIIQRPKYFSNRRTNEYLCICAAYGMFMVSFTRPVIVNSKYESYLFSPFIPGHNLTEYVNLPHAVHNISVAAVSCLLYLLFLITVFVKSRKIDIASNRNRVINNVPIFVQVVLVNMMNTVATSIYVYVNFMPASQALMVTGQIAWQCVHGLPPFIYLALNKTIRKLALRALRLDNVFDSNTVHAFSISQVTALQ